MYTVLAATSATLRQLLLDSMLADVGPSGLASFFTGSTTVSLETPREMQAAGRQGLSIWLYRVARDDQRLNDPPECGRSRPERSTCCRLHSPFGCITC